MYMLMSIGINHVLIMCNASNKEVGLFTSLI